MLPLLAGLAGLALLGNPFRKAAKRRRRNPGPGVNYDKPGTREGYGQGYAYYGRGRATVVTVHREFAKDEALQLLHMMFDSPVRRIKRLADGRWEALLDGAQRPTGSWASQEAQRRLRRPEGRATQSMSKALGWVSLKSNPGWGDQTGPEHDAFIAHLNKGACAQWFKAERKAFSGGRRRRRKPAKRKNPGDVERAMVRAAISAILNARKAPSFDRIKRTVPGLTKAEYAQALAKTRR